MGVSVSRPTLKYAHQETQLFPKVFPPVKVAFAFPMSIAMKICSGPNCWSQSHN